MVARFSIIDSMVGSSKPVVKILTEVIIALGILLNQVKIKSRSFFVLVLSKCAMGYPARLKAWNTWTEVKIPLLKIKKNEVTPQTDYLFYGLHDPNNAQKSLDKINMVFGNSFPKVPDPTDFPEL